jgi:haloalkane dehalogenase
MSEWPEWVKKNTNVAGHRMAYVEAGEGDPIVFVHGNPTSSFLWRNILPQLAPFGRCLAPDLIGMGDSDKLLNTGPQSYRLEEHQRYFDGLMVALGVTDRVTFVVHDWGSSLSFEWARRHPDKIKGIAYMESVVCPMAMEEWTGRKIFTSMRSAEGESMVLDNNVFVEKILPRSVLRAMTPAELDEYRRPFLHPGEGRRAMLTWPREMPLDGEPSDVAELVDTYGKWLATSEFPKLFINAEPGAILVGRMREFCRTWPNQREVTVPGIHFIQEDSPVEISSAIAEWMTAIDAHAQL